MKHVNALVAVALLLGGGTVQAGLINPGFEMSPDLFGWTKHLSSNNLSNAQVVTSHQSVKNPFTGTGSKPGSPFPSDYPYLYGPTEGKKFLMLGTGNSSPGIWQSVTQLFRVDTDGEILSGFAAFDWDDNNPRFDGLRVSVFQGNTTSGTPYNTIFETSGNKFINTITTPPPSYINFANGYWTQWFSAALPVGDYTIEYAVKNTLEGRNNSYGYFDAVTTVPEPASLSLLIAAWASLSAMQRRRIFLSHRSA